MEGILPSPVRAKKIISVKKNIKPISILTPFFKFRLTDFGRIRLYTAGFQYPGKGRRGLEQQQSHSSKPELVQPVTDSPKEGQLPLA